MKMRKSEFEGIYFTTPRVCVCQGDGYAGFSVNGTIQRAGALVSPTYRVTSLDGRVRVHFDWKDVHKVQRAFPALGRPLTITLYPPSHERIAQATSL